MADAPDLFLSHNSEDKPLVREVAQALRKKKLTPWFDEEDLTPGRPWQDGAEEAIRTCKAAAVFVGKSGMGPWEHEEVRTLLTQAVKRGLAVIPVLLPGAPTKPNLPLFLGERTWVDLRAGITPEGLRRLVWGTTGKKPGGRKAKAAPEPSGPPPLHNLPFSPLGELFKGRDGELRALAESLQGDGKARAIVQDHRALYGLGGIGKTRLAVEYAWQFGARYKVVLFVRAESPETLGTGLASLAVLLGVPERHAQNETLQAVLLWLQTNPGWLLILDNVDSKEAERAVLEILPRLSCGHILVTSRLSEWPPTIRGQVLGILCIEEARDYLLRRTEGRRRPLSDDSAQAEILARNLDGLPLALIQAGAYIALTRCSLSEYLKIWGEERDWVLDWHSVSMQYPVSVAATWKASFDRLLPTAATLLRLMAFLAPEPIPEEMFESELEIVKRAVGLLRTETGQGEDREIIREALGELESYCLISREDSACTIHRVVQEVVQSRIPQERRTEWIEWALRVVEGHSPRTPDDVRTWPVWNPLRPHVTTIVLLADRNGILSAGRLMGQLGTYLWARSLYAEAEPLMRRAVVIGEVTHGSEHPEVATRLNNLAQLLQVTNRFSEAEPLMRRALAIDEASLGNRHPNVARDLNNLGWLLKTTNRFSEAESLMRRALAIDEAFFGKEHPSIAQGLNNLAQLLQTTNRFLEAEPLMRRALAIDEAFFGYEHPNIATGLNNLGWLLKTTNRFSEAEPLIRRALAIDEASFGNEHPNIARDLNMLGELLQATNRLEEAEILIRRALAIDEAFFGEHPDIARDLNNLAQVLKDMNRLSEAEPLMRRALAIDEASFGNEHPYVARDLNNLAVFLQTTDRLSEAEPLIRRALAIDEASFGSEHPNVGRDLNNLAALLQTTERFLEAEPLMRRALTIDEASFGSQHPNIAIRLNNLARLLKVTNRLSEAEPLMRRAVAIWENSLGLDHPHTQIGQQNLEVLLAEMAAANPTPPPKEI